MKMHLRRLSLVLIVVFLLGAVAVTVSAQDVAREDTVIFDIDDSSVPNPTNFNYLVPGTNQNQGAHQVLWEPLFILNYETGNIDPWLGLSFTANDAQDVWTLKLRDGVTWSDGEAFTADDVMFTIQMLLDDTTKTLGGAADMQQWVSGIRKIDDMTVEFDLLAPNPRFQLDYFSVRIWGGISILPEHVWKDQDPFTFTNYDPDKGWPVGTGPYKLVSAQPTQFVWDLRDDWWGATTGFQPLPEPKRLIWQISGTEESKALLMANHQLDSVMDISLGAFEAIQAQNPNVTAWYADAPYAWPDPCPRQMTLNTTVAPWDNPDMRKAISLIIDRNQLIQIAYEDTSVPSKTMFVQYPAMDPFINAIVDAGMGIDPAGHPDEGKALIEGAGYTLNGSGTYEKDGKPLTLDIISPSGFIEATRSVNVIVEQLRAAGIDATSHPLADSTNFTNRDQGNFEAIWNWDACGSINEPWNSMNHFTGHFYVPIGQTAPGGNNYQRWNTDGTQAYTEIVDRIGSLPLGDPSIPGLVVEAYKYLYDETVIIPLTQAKKLVPFDTTYWTGWPTNDNAYIQPTTWWQSALPIILNLHKAGSGS
jgi:peptide/nickel transport system substrate-binding protein